jgi:hypothetical protein
VNVGTALIADAQPPELMEPTQRTLHDPACPSQATAMRRAPSSNHRLDAIQPQPHAMQVRVIGTVSIEPIRFPSGMTHFAPNGRDRLHQRDQLGDVMGVRPRESDGERNALRIREEVVF